jgi:hypothetical protein
LVASRIARGANRIHKLYVVTSGNSEPCLQEPIKNPAWFPWHEVQKVDHYCLSVDALTQPMRVRDPSACNGGLPR